MRSLLHPHATIKHLGEGGGGFDVACLVPCGCSKRVFDEYMGGVLFHIVVAFRVTSFVFLFFWLWFFMLLFVVLFSPVDT